MTTWLGRLSRRARQAEAVRPQLQVSVRFFWQTRRFPPGGPDWNTPWPDAPREIWGTVEVISDGFSARDVEVEWRQSDGSVVTSTAEYLPAPPSSGFCFGAWPTPVIDQRLPGSWSPDGGLDFPLREVVVHFADQNCTGRWGQTFTPIVPSDAHASVEVEASPPRLLR